MVASILFPSLSSHGWTDSPVITGDMLMAHFFVAEYSQSYIYRGYVASWPYIVQNNTENLETYASELKKALEVYFSRYFNSVVVDAAVITDPTDNNQQAISLYLEYVDYAGQKQILSKLASFIDGKFAKLTSMNNGE